MPVCFLKAILPSISAYWLSLESETVDHSVVILCFGVYMGGIREDNTQGHTIDHLIAQNCPQWSMFVCPLPGGSQTRLKL